MQLPRALLHQINNHASIGSGFFPLATREGGKAVFQFGTAGAFFGFGQSCPF